MSTPVEPWLREILRCPACRSTLLDVTGDDGAPALRCSGEAPEGGDGCRRTYRFDRGVPVLLVDEGVLPPAAEG
ncbi:hypothetical protein [Aquipuribacter hungaricus]|uniref:Trm112 family protein n=1 Tax=Aquipuribacter hungaricus TaxID=545624 RepID=A0ABV7WE95_9MICO